MSSNEIMDINWRKLVKPKGVSVVAGDRFYGKFVCEPLEKGYGLTIGNSLRRIIISSLYGAAIVSVKFDSVLHEFSSIPGVLEDVSEIILNLKEVRLNMSGEEPNIVKIDAAGKTSVTAGDIISEDGKIEVLNPDKHIATLTENDSKLNMEMLVKIDKGYMLSEINKDNENIPGNIAIDAIFSPIKRVNYTVENARVGHKIDYDKLTLEVWTDGSVLPESAVAYAAKILKEQLSIFINFDEDVVKEEKPKVKAEEQQPKFNENLYRDVEELELSVRSANCLRSADIHKIHELVVRTETEMLKTKNFGRKSLNEIKSILEEMGLSLGMNLEGFDPNPPTDDEE
jgi:DNA-directed RNA polymerase subunit alpha